LKPWVLPVAVAALIGAGVMWFLSAYERVPDREWVGPSGEARRNPFLAAERFAGRMGLPARSLRGLPELDRLPQNGALLLPAGRQAVDPRRLRHIVAWAESGGHLIAEAEPFRTPDPLLDLLGVERSAAPPAPKMPPVELPNGRRLAVSLAGGTALKLPAVDVVLQAGTRDAVRLASFERGRGMVTVAASLAFARNALLGTADNAEFLWHVVQLSPVRELALFQRPQRLSLWRFLREQAAPVLAATAALLALWLWRVAPRFGPVMPDAPPARRRLLDHLRATGRYYWARGLRPRLVIAARDAALRRVAQAQPDFGMASAEERAARLSRLASIPQEEAERFIAAGGTVRGADFIHLMRVAQRVHSALEKGNR
jgi:hypothetical protein